MLTGSVIDLQARVTIGIFDGSGQVFPYELVVDTGFDGQLALPPRVIRAFDLARGIPRYAETVTGGITVLRSYTATVLWEGQPRVVEVVETDSEPLLGMELLLGSRVILEVREGGPVTVDPLP